MLSSVHSADQTTIPYSESLICHSYVPAILTLSNKYQFLFSPFTLLFLFSPSTRLFLILSPFTLLFLILSLPPFYSLFSPFHPFIPYSLPFLIFSAVIPLSLSLSTSTLPVLLLSLVLFPISRLPPSAFSFPLKDTVAHNTYARAKDLTRQVVTLPSKSFHMIAI